MKKYLALCLTAFFMMACDDEVDEFIDDLTPDPTPAQVLDFADSALESAGGAISTQFSPRMGSCENLVNDITTDAPGVAQFLGCILNTNSKNPETMRGSFHLVNEVMKMLDEQVSFQYSSNFTSRENISGDVDTSDGIQSVTVSIRERSLSEDWDYQVQVCILSLDGNSLNNSLADCTSGAFNFEIFFSAGLNEIAFKTVENIGGFDGGSAFTLDVQEQEMMFEAWDEDNGRHQRLFVAGTVSSDFELGEVDEIAIAIADPGIETSGDGTDAIYAEFDGVNFCANIWDDDDNDHTNGVDDISTTPIGSQVDLTIFGTCSVYPVYNGGFFDQSTSVESYLSSASNEPLDFDAETFSISSYFVE